MTPTSEIKSTRPPPAAVDALPSGAPERIMRRALTVRRVEERLLKLFSEGKIFGTVHTCIGQELVGAVLAEFFRDSDTLFSNHRGHGHFLAREDDVRGLVGELMGRVSGVCGGLGGSQHLCKNGFFSNGIQGGIMPVAAGLALAARLREGDGISTVFIGDGTLGEGAVYETLNLAAKWSLPLLIVLENNGVSQSTAQAETLAGSIPARAEAFGIETAAADTWDWRGLYAVAQDAVEKVRSERRPFFLEIKTYRLMAHSKGDDLRPRQEVQAAEEKDPLYRLLREPGAEEQIWIDETRQRVDEEIAAAESDPLPVYSPPAIAEEGAFGWTTELPPKERGVKLLNRFFTDLMARDERVVFIGEDVKAPYGGAFKVSEGLSERHPTRVFNAPISESAIVGIGSGLALADWRPVVEIMFGDFIGLAFDQIVNHAAKFERMYADQVEVNLVVRTPMGGRRGYGPTHSQTLDRHLLGTPGLRVLALNPLLDPARIYSPLFAGHSGPTLVLENKLLYGTFLRNGLAPGFRLRVSEERFPTAHVQPEAARADVTLVGYGGMTELLVTAAEQLFEQHDLVAQVICPSRIYPFDVAPLLPLLAVGDALVIAEEGQGFAGFGAELVAQLAERAPELVRRTRRVMPPADIIPSSAVLERAMLPGVESIVTAAVELSR